MFSFGVAGFVDQVSQDALFAFKWCGFQVVQAARVVVGFVTSFLDIIAGSARGDQTELSDIPLPAMGSTRIDQL